MSEETGQSEGSANRSNECKLHPNRDVDLEAPGMRRRYKVESAQTETAAGQNVALQKVRDLTGMSLQMTDFDISRRARNIKTGKWNEPVEWVTTKEGKLDGKNGTWTIELNLDDPDKNHPSPAGPARPHVGHTAEFRSPSGGYKKEKGHILVASLDACRPPFPLTKRADKLRESGDTNLADRIYDQYFTNRR